VDTGIPLLLNERSDLRLHVVEARQELVATRTDATRSMRSNARRSPVIGIGSSILLDQPPVIAKERYPPIISSWVASLNRVVPRNILPLYRSPTTDVKHASSRCVTDCRWPRSIRRTFDGDHPSARAISAWVAPQVRRALASSSPNSIVSRFERRLASSSGRIRNGMPRVSGADPTAALSPAYRRSSVLTPPACDATVTLQRPRPPTGTHRRQFRPPAATPRPERRPLVPTPRSAGIPVLQPAASGPPAG